MTERWELTVQLTDADAAALRTLTHRLLTTMPNHLRTLTMDDSELSKIRAALVELHAALIEAEKESRHA